MPPDEAMDLMTLAKGTPRLTPACGEGLAECAAVCLGKNEHIDGVALQVDGHVNESVRLGVPEVTEQMAATWDDLQEATEYGASGLAVLVTHRYTELRVVRRSRKGTGFDYWLGDTTAELPFNEAAKLEVSGILRDQGGEVERRLVTKVRQVKQFFGALAWVVIVVDFGAPLARMVRS